MQSFWAHARFALINLYQIAFLWFLLLGGAWMWAGLLMAAGLVTLDEFFEDRSEQDYDHPAVLQVLLYLNLPSLLAISVVFAFYLSDADPLGLAVLAETVFGIDLVANRAATSTVELVAAGMVVALAYGAAGINAAHELCHRTHSLVDQAVARWMLAFTCDTTFPIEHVHGHHKHVGTLDDPATARRGEYILTFMLRSTVGCFANAFAIERERLTLIGRPVWSPANRALRGQAMSLLYVVGAYWLAGWTGVIVFLAVAAHGKMYLEAVNYIEHYGLVRVPGTPIRERHSWDCYNTVSSSFLYNLTRHADHHVHSRNAFWQSSVAPNAPCMPHGYMAMILLAFVPSLWRRATSAGLAHWDRNLASEDERREIANRGWDLAEPVPAAAE